MDGGIVAGQNRSGVLLYLQRPGTVDSWNDRRDVARRSLDVFRLGLQLQGDQILVEVWDGADGVPDVGLPDGLAVNGRGMFLVDALSKEWGVRPEEDGGKTVWAKLSR